MSWVTDLGDSLKKIILMEDKIDRLLGEVNGLGDTVLDHEKRLIRIETMVEVAKLKQGPTAIEEK